MTLVEVAVAGMLLALAAAGLFGAFDAGRRATSYSEEHNVANAIAEREIQRITALPWKDIANNETHQPSAESSSATDPSSYIKSAECDVGKVLPRHKPCYEYDWKTKLEPLVLEPESTLQEVEENVEDPRSFETLTPSKTSRVTGKIYHYVTWVYDEKCQTANCTSESATNSSNYKRITVAVTVTGVKQPVVLTTLYVNPEGKYANPLYQGAKCKEGATTVECTH